MRHTNLRLVLFACCGFLLLFHALLFWSVKEKALHGYADFAAFYAAGKLLQTGSASSLYDYDRQAQVQAALFPGVEIRQAPLLYYHPPFEVLLFFPLSFLPYSTAYLLWTFLNLCILLALPWLLKPDVVGLEALARPFFLFLFLAFFPSLIALIQGQDSMLLLLIFALAFRSFKRNNQFGAGCLLALGLFKFQFVLPFLVPFLLGRRWKLLMGFSFVVMVLVLVSMQVVGVRGMAQYFGFLWQLNQHLASRENQATRAIYPDTMPNLRGVLYSLGAGRAPEAYILLAIAIGSMFLLFWSARRWPRNRSEDGNSVDLPFALSLTVALLVSYHLHVHDLSLLSLPIVLVLNDAVNESSPRLLRFALLGASCAFFLSPVYLLLLRSGRLHLLFWPILFLAVGIAKRLPVPARTGGISA